ncbi:PACE efflux transporter [Roseomonas elaeocarpi]|uniref:PACE efflux transporter n=1 Tax=Roseomonas elaeocarpi TaxID=907779 RepID=A0ABV6JX20_9PROT
MRTVPDRIRHTLSFEVIGLALIIPLGHLLFNLSHEAMGVVGVGSAVVATLWNYVYNWGFDRAMLRLTGSVRKTLPVRVAHAVLFEAGLLVLLLPPIAWYLGMTLWDALVMDLAIAGFYVAYGFCFNWAYDRVFPVPGLRHA